MSRHQQSQYNSKYCLCIETSIFVVHNAKQRLSWFLPYRYKCKYRYVSYSRKETRDIPWSHRDPNSIWRRKSRSLIPPATLQRLFATFTTTFRDFCRV